MGVNTPLPYRRVRHHRLSRGNSSCICVALTGYYHLPESILALIGEKPKDVFERSLDRIEEGIKKGTDAVEDIV